MRKLLEPLLGKAYVVVIDNFLMAINLFILPQSKDTYATDKINLNYTSISKNLKNKKINKKKLAEDTLL